jgi:hypothetical protein
VEVGHSIDTIDYITGIGNGAESENNLRYHADSAKSCIVAIKGKQHSETMFVHGTIALLGVPEPVCGGGSGILHQTFSLALHPEFKHHMFASLPEMSSSHSSSFNGSLSDELERSM